MSNKYKMFKDQCGGGFNIGDKVKVTGLIKLRKPSESNQTFQTVMDKNGEIKYVESLTSNEYLALKGKMVKESQEEILGKE